MIKTSDGQLFPEAQKNETPLACAKDAHWISKNFGPSAIMILIVRSTRSRETQPDFFDVLHDGC